jgi:hypothetical protein
LKVGRDVLHDRGASVVQRATGDGTLAAVMLGGLRLFGRRLLAGDLWLRVEQFLETRIQIKLLPAQSYFLVFVLLMV